MSNAIDELETRALTLTKVERAELIERLIASVETPTLSDAWQVEIERRVSALEAGETHAVPAEEVFARMERKLRQARS